MYVLPKGALSRVIYVARVYKQHVTSETSPYKHILSELHVGLLTLKTMMRILESQLLGKSEAQKDAHAKDSSPHCKVHA